ncbi:hypothetical protein SUGI_0080690 [Cryptomeria japonica]|nr:hypothetical protein SUGI_0080690 [Cryptomeria japonica]
MLLITFSAMGNIISSHSPPPLSHASPSFDYLVPTAAYDVFINHRGMDTKQSLASLVYRNLHNIGFKVFLDKSCLRAGQCIPQAITCAIRSASVHVVILSPNYAQSPCFGKFDLLRSEWRTRMECTRKLSESISGLESSIVELLRNGKLLCAGFHY